MGLCVKAKDVTAYGVLVYSRLLIKRDILKILSFKEDKGTG